MIKRIFLISIFILFFGVTARIVYHLQTPVQIENEKFVAEMQSDGTSSFDAESVHVYKAENLEPGCSATDKIFCAIERTVKCTISPELADCDKDLVPAFILGKTEDVERPTEISFKFSKIKPIADSNDISIYTQSDCNAMWFGLCKGTVVYTLTSKNNGKWAVSNIFALE